MHLLRSFPTPLMKPSMRRGTNSRMKVARVKIELDQEGPQKASRWGSMSETFGGLESGLHVMIMALSAFSSYCMIRVNTLEKLIAYLDVSSGNVASYLLSKLSSRGSILYSRVLFSYSPVVQNVDNIYWHLSHRFTNRQSKTSTTI